MDSHCHDLSDDKPPRKILIGTFKTSSESKTGALSWQYQVFVTNDEETVAPELVVWHLQHADAGAAPHRALPCPPGLSLDRAARLQFQFGRLVQETRAPSWLSSGHAQDHSSPALELGGQTRAL